MGILSNVTLLPIKDPFLCEVAFFLPVRQLGDTTPSECFRYSAAVSKLPPMPIFIVYKW